MRLKTILSATGAVGITAALALASVAPANASDDPKAHVTVDSDRVQGYFHTWTSSTDPYKGWWNAWGAPANGVTLVSVDAGKDGAPTGGAAYTFPVPGGQAGTISPVDAPERCLTLPPRSLQGVTLQRCSESADQVWQIGANGSIYGNGAQISDRDEGSFKNNPLVRMRYSGTPAERLVLEGLKPVGNVADLVANVRQNDASSKTAVIGGTGEPGATILLEGPWGSEETVVDENGDWSKEIGGLITGDNPVKVTQKFEGAEDQTKDLTVSFDATKLTADVKSVDTDAKTGVVGGKGEPGVELEVTNPDGTSQKVTVGDNGEWTATIPNLQTGSNPVKVVQKVGEDEQEANVDITMDAAKMSAEVISVDAGDKTAVVGGKGEPGEKLEITNPDGTTQEVVIGDNGEWTATVPGLQEGENPIKVKQPSTGDEIDLVATLLPSPIVDPAIAGGAGIAALAALGTVLLVRRRNTVKQ